MKNNSQKSNSNLRLLILSLDHFGIGQFRTMESKTIKGITLLALVFVTAAFLGPRVSLAQFPIKIPKLSKPLPPPTSPQRTEPPQSVTQAETRSATETSGGNQLRIAKDSLQITTAPKHIYGGDETIWSWVPRATFQINGPVPSGSLFTAEFTIPGTGPWLKLDCTDRDGEKGIWLKVECGESIPDDKGSIYTGPVMFTIRMRNELSGSESTLLSGKARVSSTRSNIQGANAAKKYSYYVDGDWNLPIGYLYYQAGYADAGLLHPTLSFAFWARGYPYTDFKPYLFHNGNEVEAFGVCTDQVVNNPSNDTATKDVFTWRREGCNFSAVTVWDKETAPHSKPRFLLTENPGEYEIKILYKGQLIRSAKFTVDSRGIVDNGVAAANRLGSDRLILPVTITGDLDAKWDRNAWKTEAFFGNPLSGFNVPE